MLHSKAITDFRLGTVQVIGKESAYAGHADRVALLGGTRPSLYLLAVTASDSALKGIRSTLAGSRSSMTIRFQGCDFVLPNTQAADFNGVQVLLPDKFSVKIHKLGYGLIHALFRSKAPDFLVNVDEESIWQALNSPRFTTPLLREWMPWLPGELVARKHLVHLFGHRCRCGLLDLKTEELDALVMDGIRLGKLRLGGPEPSGAAIRPAHRGFSAGKGV